MSPKLLPIAVAVLFSVIVCWRITSLQSQVSELRTSMRTVAAAASLSLENKLPQSPAAAPASAESAETPGELDRKQQKLDDANARIAALEEHIEELSEAWNRFAEEEVTKRNRATMRSWGPEQITGAPDTLVAGDRPTAWASLAADGGMEWLQADYAQAVEVAQVRVLENDNPGAVVKITGYLENGGEVVLWQGNEPRLPAPADQVFNVPAGYRVRSVRVHVDTAKVPGWNEIDAVELIGRDGTRQWATGASASSTYATPPGGRNVDGGTFSFQLSE